MTTAATVPARPQGRSIPSVANRFDRQVLVELRKSVDTRSGRTLMIIIAALVLVVLAIQIALGRTVDEIGLSFGDLAFTTGVATAMLLPILGILLITSEWSQRTTLITFTLEPRRIQVIAAKLGAGVIMAVAATAVVLAIAAAATPVAGAIADRPVDWALPMGPFLGFLAQQVIAVISGMALAALILNTPASIVAYVGYALVLPMLLPLASLWKPAEKVVPWIDFSGAQAGLTATMAGSDWAHLAVSGGIWLVLPLVLGTIRIVRSEIS
ncbi:ABC transporter permease [Microlunatus elymi]|uniref:ABC transporter permease n=1 Tax=Microlunatus elymi TaxID=2596828 RepID=A0A516PV80_9ACTN|nr:ABC transporter permease [Microlunatus elymi]QDP95108.1 ABC transporter permease [Microlunatus elymi]